MKRALGIRILPQFPCLLYLSLCLVFLGTGCGSNNPPPPPPPPSIQVGLSSAAASVQAGIGTQSFTATVQNDSQNLGVTWALSSTGCTGAACGSLSTGSSASGSPVTYTAPSIQPPSSVTLTATSAADTTKSKTATITVTAPVAVSAAPTPINVQFNSVQGFTATVSNDANNKGVTWALTQSGSNCSPGCGTLSSTSSASGIPINYIGPSGVPSNPSVTLTATSIADPARNGPAAITVTVNPGNVGITISPKQAAITKSQTQAFAANITATTNTAVTWEVDGSVGGNVTVGTIDGSGNYTPPPTPGAHTVTAISQADITKTASATIGVTDLTGVTTYHNDAARDGVNNHEFALTTSNVKSGNFGKLFSCPVDGEVYAQPLWVANLAIGGGNHNVVFVATQNDSVYAFDADAKPCHQYWQKSFLSSGVTSVPPSDTGEISDINKKIGITGTPVIDPATNTVYVVVKTKEGTGNYHQRLHALSLIDATEKFSGPADITSAITVPGTGDVGDGSTCSSSSGNVPFCPLKENQRAGLALVGGNLYIAWASHGDNQPYHGWMMRFSAANLAQPPLVYNASPNGRESGIWMSGGAPAFDSSNNVYVITGNGDYDGTKDFGDSFLKLNSSLVLQDWFTPAVEATLDSQDLDLGSGGAVVLVDLPSSSKPHVLIGGGKGTNALGQIYVVNRDNMGQLNATDLVIQSFSLGGMIYSTAAFWQNTVYIAVVGQSLKAFPISPTSSMLNTTPTSQSLHAFNFPGATPAVSSAGTSGTSIVWALDTNSTTAANASGTDGPAVLYAYDALNLGTELFHSDTTSGAANAAGNAVKFVVPTIANGKVYIGTQTELSVFGLLP